MCRPCQTSGRFWRNVSCSGMRSQILQLASSAQTLSKTFWRLSEGVGPASSRAGSRLLLCDGVVTEKMFCHFAKELTRVEKGWTLQMECVTEDCLAWQSRGDFLQQRRILLILSVRPHTAGSTRVPATWTSQCTNSTACDTWSECGHRLFACGVMVMMAKVARPPRPETHQQRCHGAGCLMMYEQTPKTL